MRRKPKHKIDLDAKRTVLLRAGGKCEVCGQKVTKNDRHLHHLTYERYGNELPEDLQVVCLGCHKKYHPHCTFRTIQEQRRISAKKKKRQMRPKVLDAAKRHNADPRWGPQIVYLEQQAKKREKKQ